MPPAAVDGQSGFSLVEALVALLVIGIAAVGIVRATEGHVDSIRGLERRAAAQWVAENRLVELGLGDDRGDNDVVEMMGERWQVSVTMASSADPDMRLATVAVRGVGARAPLVTLRGFVDARTITP